MIEKGILVSLLWGSSTLLQKLLITELENKEVMYINNLLYFLVLNIYYYKDLKSIHSRIVNLTTKQVVLFILFSVVCIFYSNILYYNLLQAHAPGMVSALVSINPVWTLIGSYFLFNEVISLRQGLGVFFVLIGVYFLS